MGAVSDLLDFVFPPVCHLCGTRLTGGREFICEPCLSELPRTWFGDFETNPVALRFAGLVPFVRATSFLFYGRATNVAALIHDFKYHSMPRLAYVLGRRMGEELLSEGFFDGIDAIAYVPMHFFKQARRGYNQVEYLARGVADATSLPVFDNLRAQRRHSTQTHLSKTERQANLKGVFRVRDADELAGRHLLLLDDVCTTGATLTEAAETIIAAEPSVQISLLTLACTF